MIIEISPMKRRATHGDGDNLMVSLLQSNTTPVKVDGSMRVLDHLRLPSAGFELVVNSDSSAPTSEYEVVQSDVLYSHRDPVVISTTDVNFEALNDKLEEERQANETLQASLSLCRREIRQLKSELHDLQSERSFLVSEAELSAMQKDLEAAHRETLTSQVTIKELVAANSQLQIQSQAAEALEAKLQDIAEKNRVLAISLNTARDNIDFFNEKHEVEREKLRSDIKALETELAKYTQKNTTMKM
jgi:septal ring factor EnvC (AmiA/AmiB activator)